MAVIDRPIELEEPEVMDEVDQVLLDAAHYLEEHGWCPRPALATGEVCIIIAISKVNYDRISFEANRRLRAAIGLSPNDALSVWNDLKCRSKEEAIAMLRKAMEYK